MLSKIAFFNENYLRICQKSPWLKWTNYPFSGSISILIGRYFCHSSAYKIMTGPTAGSKWSLIPCPLGHNKLPFTCIQIKYTRLVSKGQKGKDAFAKWCNNYCGMGPLKGFCFSVYLIMLEKFLYIDFLLKYPIILYLSSLSSSLKW